VVGLGGSVVGGVVLLVPVVAVVLVVLVEVELDVLVLVELLLDEDDELLLDDEELLELEELEEELEVVEGGSVGTVVPTPSPNGTTLAGRGNGA
jgi:hypothetical protein